MGRGLRASFRACLALTVVSAAQPVVADALDRIAVSGVIRLGHRVDAPPFSYLDPDGRPAGLAVKLCRASIPQIADAAGLQPGKLVVEWVPVTAKTRFPALVEGRADLHCGPTTQTLSRRQTLDFSIPYFVEGAGIVFRKGGPETLAELTNERVGVLGGTTTAQLARRVLAEEAPDAQLMEFGSHVDGLGALQDGDVEAYLGDQSILIYQLAALRPTVPPVISDRMLSREPYALTMKRGETGLRLAVDQALSRLYRTREIRRMVVEALGRARVDPAIEAIHEVVALPD